MTQPETALHINLKCHLAAELEAARRLGQPLRIHRRCRARLHDRDGDWEDAEVETAAADWEVCSRFGEHVWLETWDEVVLESRVGERVPDIVLKRAGQVVGAVEVFVTHAVDEAKAAELAALGVPWPEVRGEERLLDPAGRWTADQPLPVHREGPSRRWRCPVHEAAAAKRREERRYGFRVCALRAADLYYPSGKRYRRIYRVVEHTYDGVPRDIRLLRDDEVSFAVPCERHPKAVLWRLIREAYEAEVAQIAKWSEAIVDSPMTWVMGELAEDLQELAERRFVHSPLERIYPRRYFWNPKRQEWFLPADMRDVTWDRPPDEPHPASWRRPGRAASGTETALATTTESEEGARRRQRAVSRRLHASDDRLIEPLVVTMLDHTGATIYELRTPPGTLRALAIPNTLVEPKEAWDLHLAYTGLGAEVLWLAFRGDWARPVDLPWLRLVRDPDGRLWVERKRGRQDLRTVVESFAAGLLGSPVE